MNSQTSNMKVEQVGFLLERLAEDCSSQQFVRELTQNAIEAILRLLDSGGEIWWGLDNYTFEDSGKQKLCIVDTGVGMSGDEMIQHINHLSSSGGLQSLSGNYGLGAKISAATRNKAGIIYASWQHKNDPGAVAWLWRDPLSGEYGLKRIEVGGEFHEITIPKEGLKPDLIKKAGHGTVVILLGDELDQNTFAPEGMGTEWVAKYLEERYFVFPDNIAVRAQDTKTDDEESSEVGSSRPVHGRKKALADLCKSSGSVELRGATAHWWIIDSEAKLKAHSIRRFGGYTAALYQNELYEATVTTARRPRLQSFGCTFSYNDVVIFVEPHSSHKKLTTNTARTAILIGGEPLPWDDWAAEFRNRLPQEIQNLEETISATAIGGHKESIQQRISKFIGLFKLSRYRPVMQGGTHEILTETLGSFVRLEGGKKAKEETCNITKDGPSSEPRLTLVKNKRGGISFGVAAKEGTGAIEIESAKIPEVRWLPPPDLDETLVDRAAYYEPMSNTIMANSLFRGFTDMVDHWKKQYGGLPGAENKITDVVREAFEQQLIETVLGLQSLKNREHWTQQQIESAWSAEALTAAVMARSQALAFVSRALKLALGSSNRTVDAA
jgi:hypothetical protein